MIDVKIPHPNGEIVRIRRVSPEQSRAGARRYEHEIREQVLRGELGQGEDGKLERPAPLDQWVEIFIRDHSEAKGLRPSTIREQRTMYRLYLLPALGPVRIDKIRTPHFHKVRRFMADLQLGAKSMNNALSVLSRSTRFYYERQGLPVPHLDACMVKVPKSPPKFWEPAQYEAIIQVAAELGPCELATVLLMGDCGLRTGEVIALEWSHVRWQPTPMLVVQRSYTAGDFGPTKAGRPRTVPMTSRTAAALRALPRRLDLPWVMTRDSKWGAGHAVRGSLAWLVCKAERRAGYSRGRRTDGQLHKLRHTYVTRLAAAGVSARMIMELAGHKSLATSLRYMHVLPNENARAVSMLERFDSREDGGAPVGAPPLLVEA